METPFYPIFNRALASKDRQEAKKFFKFLRLALGGIHKLPLLRGMFARGTRNPNLANYYDGRTAFFWWAFTSTTKKVGVTKQFLGNGLRMLFMIDGVGGHLPVLLAPAPAAPAPPDPASVFEFGGLVQELGLLDGDMPEIIPVLEEHGLVTAGDILGFLTDECGGVTADGLRIMGIAKYGTRSRMLQGLLPKKEVEEKVRKGAEEKALWYTTY
jgi:hypothetical protein